MNGKKILLLDKTIYTDNPGLAYVLSEFSRLAKYRVAIQSKAYRYKSSRTDYSNIPSNPGRASYRIPNTQTQFSSAVHKSDLKQSLPFFNDKYLCGLCLLDSDKRCWCQEKYQEIEILPNSKPD